MYSLFYQNRPPLFDRHEPVNLLRPFAAVAGAFSALLLGAILAPRADAQTTLYFDADGNSSGATGGTGPWDTTSSLWRLGSATGALQTYSPNSNPSTVTANFSGTAGTVTIASNTAISANTLTFGTSGYVIASGSGGSLNLSGTTPTINGSGTTTFTNKITGSAGFTLNGGNFNVFAGDLTGLTGTINVDARATLQGIAYGASGVAAGVLTGSQDQTWNISSGNILTSNNQGTAATIQLGALTGSGTIRSGNNGNGAVPAGDDIFQVGALNTSTTFSGTFIDQSTNNITGLTKAGTGNLTLTGYSTNTGGTAVNAGTLTLDAGGGTGTVRGVVSVNSGATLTLAAVDALGYTSGSQVTTLNINHGTVNNTTTGNEGFLTSFNLTGGAMTSTGGGFYNIYPGGTGAPGITSNASGTVSTISGAVDIRGGALDIAVASGFTSSGVDLLISGVINDTGSSGGGALTKTGSGYLNLTGENTFTGNVTVSGGTLNVGAVGNNSGSYSTLGLANGGKAITVSSGATLSGTVNNWFGNGTASDLPTITVNGGTLSTTRYTAIGALALNGGIVMASATDSGNYQAFAFTGNVTVGGSSPSTISSTNITSTTGGYHLGANTTFTVASTGSSTPDLTVSAPLINQSGDFGNAAGGLTKAGAGTMALTAINTYTGPTTVNAGTLLVNGSTAAASAVTVSNSGTILGGTGTVAGTVTVNSGATISAGNTGSATPVGLLTVGALGLETGSTFNAFVASNTSFSTLKASGTTALGNAAFSISLTPSATLSTGEVFELITSKVSGTFTDATYTTGGYTFTADYTSNPGYFDVEVSSADGAAEPGPDPLPAVPEPASTWLMGVFLTVLLGVSRFRKVSPV